MREVLLLYPTAVACPVVRVCGVLRTCCIEVAIRLLCFRDDVNDRVTVSLQAFVWIGLKDVSSSYKCLIRIGVIKRVAHAIDLKHF